MEKEKDTIELGENDAAFIIKEDGSMEIHVPKTEHVSLDIQFVTAMFCLMESENREFIEFVWDWWQEQIDRITAKDNVPELEKF